MGAVCEEEGASPNEGTLNLGITTLLPLHPSQHISVQHPKNPHSVHIQVVSDDPPLGPCSPFNDSQNNPTLLQSCQTQAWDSDAGVNSQLRYSFVERPGDGSDRFQIEPATGQVMVTMVNWSFGCDLMMK